jgi:hypothetical protein
MEYERMNTLQEFVYQIATNSAFRSQLQVMTLAQPFTQEEQEALSSLSHLLVLPIDKLLNTLPEPTTLDGWFWP